MHVSFPSSPLSPSGLRLGTPAATTRGFGEREMRQLAAWIAEALRQAEDDAALAELRSDVDALCAGFPVPGLPDA